MQTYLSSRLGFRFAISLMNAVPLLACSCSAGSSAPPDPPIHDPAKNSGSGNPIDVSSGSHAGAGGAGSMGTGSEETGTSPKGGTGVYSSGGTGAGGGGGPLPAGSGSVGGATGAGGGSGGANAGNTGPTGTAGSFSSSGSGSGNGSGAGSYNYAEALQKAIMFYEFQRSGKLPANTRNNWRGDSGLTDGADNGVDLTGGWYDAGDHVKFNLPMAYSVAMMAWSVYEYPRAYEKTGELVHILDNIKWAASYLIKCHAASDTYYYQVGDPNKDHAFWGPAEVLQMDRPSFKVTSQSGGSTVTAETAAALAATAVVFQSSDPTFAAECLTHAEQLFTLAATAKSDTGYTAANGYYSSSSGFYDELSWAAVWLYLATGEKRHLDDAESYVSQWGTEQQTSIISYKWGQCWDDVHYGAQLLLAKITGKSIYAESVERNLDYWTVGYEGNRITYTPKGLAWLSSWGSLRYATTTAFLASVWADWPACTASKSDTYRAFTKSQIDYALGSTGKSFEVGFGSTYPKHPHHRLAHSSWADLQTIPTEHRHTLVGALAGGPGQDDSYKDQIDDYVSNEVACDYNAGFVGALAKMTDQLGGKTIPDLQAIETPSNDEYYVEAAVNAKGPNFIEIKAVLNDKTGWPARVDDKLSFRYFFDISEFAKNGASASDVTLSTNYSQGATAKGPTAFDASKNLYYVTIDFTGTKIYPGGQSAFKKEAQFRIAGPQNTSYFDATNDWSFQGIGTDPSAPTQTTKISVYRDGTKIYGQEPQ